MHGQAAEGQAEQPHEVRTAASSSDCQAARKGLEPIELATKKIKK